MDLTGQLVAEDEDPAILTNHECEAREMVVAFPWKKRPRSTREPSTDTELVIPLYTLR
jgi:hypothetical protein